MGFPSRLPIPNEVLRIAQKLERAGYETWCVGGAIRDNLLGFDNKDFDLATAARPEEVRKLFRRTVPVGIEHGTVAVLDRKKQPHEVTTFRRDVTTDGRHAVVEFGADLDEDLARRDFTINAIAYHPIRHEWRDLFDGAGDLERKLIRAVGDPARRFHEDFLRILRALRFAARFGFDIEPETWEAAKANVEGVKHLSAERVRDEWFKGLETAGKPSELLGLWWDVGAVTIWFPEFGSGERGAGPEFGSRERGAVPTDAGAIDRFELRDPVLMTAYLSADPPETLARLKCSNAETERGRRIGEFRGELPDPYSDVAVRRWMAAVLPALDDLLGMAAAERADTGLADAVRQVQASGAPLVVGDLAIDGNDLKELGVPEGPEVGEILRSLLDQTLDDPGLNTRAHLLKSAAAMLASNPAHSAQRTASAHSAQRTGERKRGKA